MDRQHLSQLTRKVCFSAALLLLLSSTSSATQPEKSYLGLPTISVSDTADYIGKYRYEGLPFEYMTISVKEGKLYYSGGEYSGYMEPIKDKKDVFDAGGIAIFMFGRDAANKVKELAIDYQGQTFLGRKEEN